jgi:hypothetical protein
MNTATSQEEWEIIIDWDSTSAPVSCNKTRETQKRLEILFWWKEEKMRPATLIDLEGFLISFLESEFHSVVQYLWEVFPKNQELLDLCMHIKTYVKNLPSTTISGSYTDYQRNQVKTKELHQILLRLYAIPYMECGRIISELQLIIQIFYQRSRIRN